MNIEMNSDSRIRKLFSETLDIEEERVVDSLEYNSIPQWDSIAHMKLVVAIESEFDIMLETEEIIDMSSFKRAKEIIRKHGV